jgi:hypothetical protein
MMKKKTKKAANQPVLVEKREQSASAMASTIYEIALEDIRDELQGLHDGSRKPPKRFTRVDRIAYLAKQASAFAAEARKERAAALAGTHKLTPALVELWLQQQTPEYLGHLVREIGEWTSGEQRSVLG